MTDETTTEQLAEIEGQGESTPVMEYTPPEGWRVLAVGERLRDGDVTVRRDGYQYPTERVGDVVGANQRYIRQIEPQPEPQQYTPPEGWRVVRFGEQLLPGDVWVSHDGTEQRSAILHWDASAVSGGRCIRRIEPEPQPQPHAAAIEELRSEVSYVQRLLGESRQRVTQLEELVSSLRTINEGCENAVRDAGKDNTALRNKLAAVKAELVTQAETSRRLQIELDAAQQVPAAIADRFEEGWNQGTARAVESVLEWLQPIRAIDNEHLSNETLQHLPQIMRHLTGLDSHAID